MASFTGLKQMGGGLLDYMMKHRPEVDEDMSLGLHDVEGMFPGIYGKRPGVYSTHSGAAVDSEAMAAINAAQGNPDAEVDIFRAVPRGVRDFNVGDWVTTSKSYAHKHGGHALNGEYDIITGKAKASDLYNPGDSIAEMGYWGLPMPGKVTRGLIPAVGAGGLLALMDADEAEAAVRPDIEDVIGKAIDGQAWAGRKAGSLESSVAKDALDGSAKYNGGDGYFTEHGLTWRNESNGWTPAQIAEGYRGIYDSPDTVVVPNVLGVNPSAKEALWNPNGKDSRSWYMPIAPYKKGFKGVTLYDPEASQVERLLKDRGYWEGGSTSSIFTPTLGERSKSIGSGTLSAVNSPSFENTIRGLDAWSKRNLPKVAGSATGAAIPLLTPEEAEADAPFSSGFWPAMARQFGLGTRGVIEGLGTGATLGFGDPGRWVADAIGLPSPETDIERQRVGLNAGVTDALTTFVGGAGAAKMAANPVIRGVGMELADKPLLGAGLGGILGLLTYNDEE